MISAGTFDNQLFEITGPLFVYADKDKVMDIWEIIEETYFMELINPFVNYNVFKRSKILETDSELYNDSIFVESTGTLIRGLGDV